jgi:hypothetical protein
MTSSDACDIVESEGSKINDDKDISANFTPLANPRF